ncbi:hypothetical protein A2454_01055 [Candidatus Peribacteria bacterium RIFOXYC2_FULL_55_14]|nr:MAG: hypothetical protein UY87_C0017G0004 [Candidatus Peribacteria bacterium GW2011_GWC2_54_8]KKW44576.1 MAG: hypothetical protein UY90_C0007G0022 [Candidatus Peregrinibacteria bacterium GW2011_GWA2_54_9]OGJ71708.1 MAG: hypothetical protein A2198_00060 [Candidatus Peribacteria bacterium RIFOXYA1_FULL_56_14]OGJ73319.1 MAG: hypothetical protein A2217_01245 [Candidatus Peribacteria bacterium RIFOXYA2_FULL_55_28]OGJ74501.1 MAG: hypothetical protein A2384_02535 [Candidatus Peribacteria bacterium 
MWSLFRNSWNLFVRSFALLLASAVVLAVLYALLVTFLSRAMDHDVAKVAQSFGLPEERYEEYMRRMETGDGDATMEMMQEISLVAEQLEHMTEGERETYVLERARSMTDALSPYFLLFGVFSLILLFCGALVSLVVFAEDHGHVIDVLRRCGILFFPMLVVWLWAFARSFGWVVFLGFLPGLAILMPVLMLVSSVAAIVMGPLLVFAPVLLVQERLSPAGAVRESLRRSKGHWGRIVGPLLVLGVLMTLLHVLLSGGVSAVARFSEGGAFFLGGLVQQLTVFFCMAFLLVLLRSLPAEQRSR